MGSCLHVYNCNLYRDSIYPVYIYFQSNVNINLIILCDYSLFTDAVCSNPVGDRVAKQLLVAPITSYPTYYRTGIIYCKTFHL